MSDNPVQPQADPQIQVWRRAGALTRDRIELWRRPDTKIVLSLDEALVVARQILELLGETIISQRSSHSG